MDEPKDTFCRMFVRLPLQRTTNKQDNLREFQELIFRKSLEPAEIHEKSYINNIDFLVAKNPGHDESEEQAGDFMSFYYMMEIDPGPGVTWNDFFDSVCGLVAHIRKLGGNAVPACDYEEEIYRKIGSDPQVKF